VTLNKALNLNVQTIVTFISSLNYLFRCIVRTVNHFFVEIPIHFNHPDAVQPMNVKEFKPVASFIANGFPLLHKSQFRGH